MLALGRIACPTYESATLLLFRRTSVTVWCAALIHMQSHCRWRFRDFIFSVQDFCKCMHVWHWFILMINLVISGSLNCNCQLFFFQTISVKSSFPNIGGSNLGRHIEFILSLLKDWTMRHLWGVQAFSTTDFHLIATFHPKKSDGAKINPFQKSVKLLWEIWKGMWIKSPLFWKSVKSVAPSWLGNLLWVYLWLPHSLP